MDHVEVGKGVVTSINKKLSSAYEELLCNPTDRQRLYIENLADRFGTTVVQVYVRIEDTFNDNPGLSSTELLLLTERLHFTIPLPDVC